MLSHNTFTVAPNYTKKYCMYSFINRAFVDQPILKADSAATGYWSSPDRSNLGVLFYRGVELLRSNTLPLQRRALALLKISADNYRQMPSIADIYR